ncbi:MAG: acyl-CoA thioesterase [Planctomycetes bacterium]|nr:acyl-CoA thioesterase [Planctomycetota bacterium]
MKRIKSRIEPHWDSVEVVLPVHFSEVDSMKLVWHGHYLRYVESAREAYFRDRGLSYQQMEDGDCIAPVVRLQIEYLAPARMGQVITARCAHIPLTGPTFDLFYEVRGPSADPQRPGKLLCIAETVQVFIDRSGQPYLSPPPPVEALFADIHARELALAERR